MKRIGILTSGGDAPGMNAAIRAAVRAATTKGIETVGYQDGYTGLVNNNYQVLDDRAVGNMIQRGGTFLGTSRCPEFHIPAVRGVAIRQLQEEAVEGLIVVGGDGSFRGALAIESEYSIPIIGIPGTIDNDVWGTEETLGFDTAVNTAVLAIDQVRDTSESTGMMFFIEVMGRSSGEIALYTAVAAGAAGVLVPEASIEITDLVRHLKRSIARGKRSHIIVVAEGDEAGGAFGVARLVTKAVDAPHRVVVLGHIQRGGRPTARDRLIASEAGSMAVTALVEGRTGVMIGRQAGRSVEVSLQEVVDHQHPDPRLDLLELAVQLSG